MKFETDGPRKFVNITFDMAVIKISEKKSPKT
jgi:hypothetical protein